MSEHVNLKLKALLQEEANTTWEATVVKAIGQIVGSEWTIPRLFNDAFIDHVVRRFRFHGPYAATYGFQSSHDPIRRWTMSQVIDTQTVQILSRSTYWISFQRLVDAGRNNLTVGWRIVRSVDDGLTTWRRDSFYFRWVDNSHLSPRAWARRPDRPYNVTPEEDAAMDEAQDDEQEQAEHPVNNSPKSTKRTAPPSKDDVKPEVTKPKTLTKPGKPTSAK